MISDWWFLINDNWLVILSVLLFDGFSSVESLKMIFSYAIDSIRQVSCDKLEMITQFHYLNDEN